MPTQRYADPAVCRPSGMPTQRYADPAVCRPSGMPTQRYADPDGRKRTRTLLTD
jgi:hypothetical protein